MLEKPSTRKSFSVLLAIAFLWFAEKLYYISFGILPDLFIWQSFILQEILICKSAACIEESMAIVDMLICYIRENLFSLQKFWKNKWHGATHKVVDSIKGFAWSKIVHVLCIPYCGNTDDGYFFTIVKR